MKKILLLVAIVPLFCVCKSNEPKLTHQPADPSTWSPVGHLYVADMSDNPHGLNPMWHVIYFFSKDSALLYGTIHSDYAPMPEEPFYTPCRYKVAYPDVTFRVEGRDSKGFFTDTLTLTTTRVHKLYH